MTTPNHGNPPGGASWPPQPPYGPPPLPQPIYGAPTPQPGPWAPPAGGWWGPPPPAPPRRRRNGWLYAALAVIVIAVGGGIATIAAYHHYHNSDSTKIKALINAFSESVSKGNPQEIAGLMCREEAEPYLDSVADPGGEVANADKPKFKIGGVVVRGNAASANLLFQDNHSQTMYFRKEEGRWTVCAPAKDQL